MTDRERDAIEATVAVLDEGLRDLRLMLDVAHNDLSRAAILAFIDEDLDYRLQLMSALRSGSP